MIWPFRRKRLIDLPTVSPPLPITIGASPDSPLPFGYKTVWWAIRCSDVNAVAEAIRLDNPQPCNWASGIHLAYNAGLFVTPPIDDWILICGRDLPPNSEAAANQIKERLCILSQQFGEVQAFATHRIVDYHVWARSRDGALTRGFGYLGESGETFWDEGFDDAEDNLGFDFADINDDLTDDELDAAKFPSEDNVMDVARIWSICPVELGDHLSSGVGMTGGSAKFFLDA